jgi:hypothetical protein
MTRIRSGEGGGGTAVARHGHRSSSPLGAPDLISLGFLIQNGADGKEILT